MRKVLILAAALALSAGPALAQQAQDVAAPQQPAVTQLAPAQAQPAEAPVKPAPRTRSQIAGMVDESSVLRMRSVCPACWYMRFGNVELRIEQK